MEPYPHHYRVSASAEGESLVPVSAAGLPDIDTAPPPEFGGPGDKWSPETMLVATVSNCFILTFRSVARLSKVDWTRIRCHTEGILDRVDKVTRFVEFKVRADLDVPAGVDVEKATRALEKAEHACLVTRSLNGTITLETHVEVGG